MTSATSKCFTRLLAFLYAEVINFSLLVEVTRELDLALEDLLVNGHGVVIVEGVDSGNHFVCEDAKRPPVYWLTVALIEEHFGRQVLGSPAQGVGPSVAVLSEAEVGQLQVTLLVNQDVFRLQVTIHDVLRVHILKHQANLGRIEPKTVITYKITVNVQNLTSLQSLDM